MASDVERVDPPLISDEPTSLTSWLDFHRATLLQKCEGLTDEEMVQAAVPTTNLTLLGLLQHMWLVEWWWFEHIFADGSSPEPVPSEGDPEYEFTHLVPAEVDHVRQAFLAECERSRFIVAGATDLDQHSAGTERPPRDLRWIMVHMIEEYARHNGHADLLREAIDGSVGD
jgi:hypothetical protein